jgi:hypothetical protein
LGILWHETRYGFWINPLIQPTIGLALHEEKLRSEPTIIGFTDLPNEKTGFNKNAGAGGLFSGLFWKGHICRNICLDILYRFCKTSQENNKKQHALNGFLPSNKCWKLIVGCNFPTKKDGWFRPSPRASGHLHQLPVDGCCQGGRKRTHQGSWAAQLQRLQPLPGDRKVVGSQGLLRHLETSP